MSIDKMLEYQKIDQEVYKVELDLNRSKEVARINSLKNQLAQAEATIIKLNKETEDLFRYIEGLEKDIAAVLPDKGIIDAANTLEKADSVQKTLSNCLETLANLEKDYKKAFDRLSAIGKEATRQFDQGRFLAVEQKKAREEYAVIFNKARSEQKDNFVKLSSLAAEIDPKLMARYKTLRDNRKMPAIVSYDGINCTGCGLDIKAEVDEKLRSAGDLAECPHCRRIVFVK